MSHWALAVLLVASSLAPLGTLGLPQFQNYAEIERESINSPRVIGAARQASQLFNGRFINQNANIPTDSQLAAISNRQGDLFECVDPSRTLYDNFVRQYNRTFDLRDPDRLNRLELFMTTLRRTILLNRVIQNEILNATNYNVKPAIRNYKFLAPVGAQGAALWYADITDCELGLIKYIIFDLFYRVENNDLARAYQIALDNVDHLPLLNDDGFEQVADILLVRLFDRFKGDDKMNQLFQWPQYLKKLAGYAYSRQQMSQPNFNAKLDYITFAYPAYFKDIKYSPGAVDRTGDNHKMHADHEKFIQLLERRIASRNERNKRLAIFRQNWTKVNLLNGLKPNVSLPFDWQRISGGDLSPQTQFDSAQSAKLQLAPPSAPQRYKLTQFGDLTDAEFVAFLTNDYSLLNNDVEAANYIDKNFKVRVLSQDFKNEIAMELELRRGKHLNDETPEEREKSLNLARQVIEELIADVGLPIGPVAMDNITETEYYNEFSNVINYFTKTYDQARQTVYGLARYESLSPDLSLEKQSRYSQFKENYARFKAWFIKEGWADLAGDSKSAMLRLADMSWQEIKLTLFKVCCLTEDNLAALSSSNSTIQYLGSNKFLCQEMSTRHTKATTQAEMYARDLAAIEVYYYYCVHFNKHHSDVETLNRRFSIFRRNIDAIRRHSCSRGLTLYESFRLKRADTLNTIDTLDPRRSYTDDINLDRYEYFTVPNLATPTAQQDQSGFERLRAEPPYEGGGPSQSRFDLSYRREPIFSKLYRNPSELQNAGRAANVAERLVLDAQDTNSQAAKYRQNAAHRVYDIVVERYRICMKTLGGVDLRPEELRLQCQANGPLGDQAVNNELFTDNPANLRLQSQQQREHCAFYKQGLERWAEGLIKQDNLSARLISAAKCQQ